MNSRSKYLRTFTPAALVLAGALIGSALSPMFAPAPAAAARPDPEKGDTISPFNAGDQRRQMITQLTEMNQRLGRLESKINSGLTVKVTEMPAVTVKDTSGK